MVPFPHWLDQVLQERSVLFSAPTGYRVRIKSRRSQAMRVLVVLVGSHLLVTGGTLAWMHSRAAALDLSVPTRIHGSKTTVLTAEMPSGAQPPMGDPVKPQPAAAPIALSEDRGSGPFTVLEASATGDGTVRFRPYRMRGEELPRGNAGARRRVPSMNQDDFPEPESGCGPTAVLNWVLWMQDQNLLRKPSRAAPERERAKDGFLRIEREIFGLRGKNRSASRGASNAPEIISAMDRMAHELSDGEVRMAYRQFEAPLRVADLLEFTSGYRSGILIVRVVDDLEKGTFGEYHAVSLVAGDTSGHLMINNWGEQVYGALRHRPDGQYFYSSTNDHPPLKVEMALCFIPFRPTDDRPPAPLESGGFASSR